jgi:hypothetical protein
MVLIGGALFLFLVWRRLKEDYSANIIFSLEFFVLTGVLVGFLVSLNFLPAWGFWLEAFGAFLGFSFGIFKFNLRFFETFEAVFVAFLPWISLFYLNNFFKSPGWGEGFLFVFNLLLIFLFDFTARRYKNFSWYKSGRIGLAGLLTAGVFFLLRAAIATILPFMVSFSGRSEAILSGICAFSLFLLIFNLAKA